MGFLRDIGAPGVIVLVLAALLIFGPKRLPELGESIRKIFITGHIEYEADTLQNEYLRDKNSNLPIEVPYNYYPNDDDTKIPQNTWRGVAYLFYHNWINQVYQLTPYDLKELAK